MTVPPSSESVERPHLDGEGEVSAERLPLITRPGAYDGISNEDYHGTEICPAPSISSSGLKLINARSPAHYWWQSPMNPARPDRKQKAHFNLGAALHDVLLLGDGRFEKHYYVLPEGFDPRATRVWADYIEARDYAIRKGRMVLTKAQFDTMQAMAEAVSKHELAGALLTAGTPEMTLAAIDPETGCWLRARPDNLPFNMEIIPDIKTAADASLDVYERAATRFGYFMSAAHYLDVIDLIYGEAKRSFVLITIEKDPPYCVALYELPGEDIERGRALNRFAIDAYAKCIESGKWPGYADTPTQVWLPYWARKLIDEGNAPEGVACAQSA